MINITREKTCCFTGHRPEKLKGKESTIIKNLSKEIEKAICEGYDTFISGMAPGVDIWAAEEILRMKESGQNIRLVCSVPFENVEKNRSEKDKEVFRDVIERCDETVYICKKYARWCFLARDRWMVDNSARVIAVFNGAHGGTEYTVNYARSKERDVILIDDTVII